MIFKIRLDKEADADLIAALAAMPKGHRSTQAKRLLRLALAGTGGLLVRMEALERRLEALEDSHRITAPAPGSIATPTVDAQKVAVSLFQKFGVFDD